MELLKTLLDYMESLIKMSKRNILLFNEFEFVKFRKGLIDFNNFADFLIDYSCNSLNNVKNKLFFFKNLDETENKRKYYQEIFNIDLFQKVSFSVFKKQIENIFLFQHVYELGILEHHSKNLKLLDENFTEKQLLNFGDAIVHEVLFHWKNENNCYLIVLRSDNSIYFHDSMKPSIYCYMQIPEYQNCLLFNVK